jgi:hypothetical protein
VRPVSSTLFVVVCEPPAGKEAEFHDWYDNVHGPDALGNGSFTSLRRYRAVGPGWCHARFVNLWEGDYESEKAAWEYIQPRADELHARGRVSDLSGVTWATMMLVVPTDDDGRSDTSTLTTVQSDWRAPDTTPDPRAWLARTGLDRLAKERGPDTAHACFTTDPAGRGPGYHLALFEAAGSPDDAIAAWEGIGAAGMSPTPPFKTMFGASVGGAPEGVAEPELAPAWTMHWELITAMRAQ